MWLFFHDWNIGRNQPASLYQGGIPAQGGSPSFPSLLPPPLPPAPPVIYPPYGYVIYPPLLYCFMTMLCSLYNGAIEQYCMAGRVWGTSTCVYMLSHLSPFFFIFHFFRHLISDKKGMKGKWKRWKTKGLIQFNAVVIGRWTSKFVLTAVVKSVNALLTSKSMSKYMSLY